MQDPENNLPPRFMQITLNSVDHKNAGVWGQGGALLGKRKEGRGSTGVGGEGEKEMVKMIKIYCTLA